MISERRLDAIERMAALDAFLIVGARGGLLLRLYESRRSWGLYNSGLRARDLDILLRAGEGEMGLRWLWRAD